MWVSHVGNNLTSAVSAECWFEFEAFFHNFILKVVYFHKSVF